MADKYHPIRKVNRMMDQVRIRLQRRERRGRKPPLYRKRYLLLKAAESSEEKIKALGELLASYPELADALEPQGGLPGLVQAPRPQEG